MSKTSENIPQSQNSKLPRVVVVGKLMSELSRSQAECEEREWARQCRKDGYISERSF